MLIGVIVLCCLLVVIGCIVVSRKREDKQVMEFPYQKRHYLCTRNERKFFRYLTSAVARNYLILTKVRLGDIVVVSGVADRKNKLDAYDRISQRNVDFVLVDKATTEIKLVIDLFDDHINPINKIQQAVFIDKLCERAELPLLRVRYSDNYSIPDLRKSIEQAVSRYDGAVAPQTSASNARHITQALTPRGLPATPNAALPKDQANVGKGLAPVKPSRIKLA